MNPDADQFRRGVFGCEICAGNKDFQRPAGGAPLYKFPPILGAQKPAPLLFIGINPRRSGSNQELHDWLMTSPEAFGLLSGNHQRDGRPYISINGGEPHYRFHAAVVEGVFGAGTTFESKAAVTELYLCASQTGAHLLDLGKSPCADRYLSRVIEIVQPDVIIAVGSGVRRHLEQHFRETVTAPVVKMEHPRFLYERSTDEKARVLQGIVAEVHGILRRTARDKQHTGTRHGTSPRNKSH